MRPPKLVRHSLRLDNTGVVPYACSSAAKSAPSMAHIAELKSGKVIWKQKPLACDKLSDTLQGPVVSYTVPLAR